MRGDGEAKAKARAVRPRPSASLIVIDRSGEQPRFLIGRRHDAHVFMPGKFVFPGGKLERSDARLAANPLREADAALLAAAAKSRPAHALAIAAVREAWEEASISISDGEFNPATGHNPPFRPDLSALAFVARAITPPGYPRRYDTSFFAVFRDRVREDSRSESGDCEMTEFGYYSHAETAGINLPSITRIILQHVCDRLKTDPLLEMRQPLPTFRTRRGKFVCEWH